MSVEWQNNQYQWTEQFSASLRIWEKKNLTVAYLCLKAKLRLRLAFLYCRGLFGRVDGLGEREEQAAAEVRDPILPGNGAAPMPHLVELHSGWQEREKELRRYTELETEVKK